MLAVDNIDGSLEAEVVVAASLTSSSFPRDTNRSIQRKRNWKTCTQRWDVACDRTSGISDRAVSKNDPFLGTLQQVPKNVARRFLKRPGPISVDRSEIRRTNRTIFETEFESSRLDFFAVKAKK